MDFYDKFVDRFQDLPKVKSPDNYLELSKENVLGILCCHIDHALLESSS